MDVLINQNGHCDQSEWTLWLIKMETVTNQNRCCDQSGWTLWPIIMDAVTNQNGHDQWEMLLWPIKMDTLINQNDDQLEWPLWLIRMDTAITAAMAVAACTAEYQPWLGQCNCAKLVNAGCTEKGSGPAGSTPSPIWIPPIRSGLGVQFLWQACKEGPLEGWKLSLLY